MKLLRSIAGAALLMLLAPALTGCGGGCDYSSHISELRSDIFRAETEEFTVTLSCITREYPYATDGVVCPVTNLVEITLSPAAVTAEPYSVFCDCGQRTVGGEMSFRNFAGDFFYSESVEAFPEKSVSLRVEWGDEVREITATSVKNDKTLSPYEALDRAVDAERQRVGQMTEGGTFYGEFYVRLLRRDKNYYYVGIVNKSGGVLSLLLDGETGEVLARRGK